MKNVFRLSGIALAVALACIFAACVGPEGPQGPAGGAGNSAEYVTVTFNPDGGEIDGKKGLLTQGLVKGGWAVKPTDPAKEAGDEWRVAGLHRSTADGKISHSFAGWYLGDSNEPWAFNHDAVTKNITLKARWEDPVSINEVAVNDLGDAISYANTNPGTYLMLLNGAPPTSTTWPQKIEGHLVIAATTSTPIQISRTADVNASGVGLLFTLQSSSSLTIGENVTLRGVGAALHPVVRVNSGANFIMDTGSIISGNTNSYYLDDVTYGGGCNASAVYVNGGTFTMRGGTITGNSATGVAGYGAIDGVWVGGAVVLHNGGSFTMSGNASITGNTTTLNRVAGVNVLNGRFTMSGGNITGNIVSAGANNYNTGGVFVAPNANARFLMTGGRIAENTTTTGVNTARQDVFVDRVAAGNGSISLSRDADIEKLTLNATLATQTTFVTIASPGLTPGGSTNIILNLRGINTTGTYWPNNTAVLQQATGYSLKQSDVVKFTLGMHFDAAAASAAIPDTGPTAWSINNSGRLVHQP